MIGPKIKQPPIGVPPQMPDSSMGMPPPQAPGGTGGVGPTFPDPGVIQQPQQGILSRLMEALKKQPPPQQMMPEDSGPKVDQRNLLAENRFQQGLGLGPSDPAMFQYMMGGRRY